MVTIGDRGKKSRVLSGMRPTGRLHIGHYFGALQNWVRLQNDPAYECFYFIADWHALTSDYADTSGVAENTLQIMIDYLAAGLDPAKSVIFQQSVIPEHAELHLLLSMVTPLGWLERVPTYKEALDNVQDRDLHTYGFLGYPVLQTSDIVMYGDPENELIVPVGEDQAAHVELGHEIVRRFNFFFAGKLRQGLTKKEMWEVCEILIPNPPPGYYESGPQGNPTVLLADARSRYGLEKYLTLIRENPRYFTSPETLREPRVLLTKTPRIPGTDGRKMSKSYHNSISLSASDDSIRLSARLMMTDPARKRRTDPGNPDICPVYDWHKLFSPPETLSWSAAGCRSAGIGCIECKMAMADNLIKWIEPVRARREEHAAHPDKVLRILDDGSLKAREVAQKTMARVREAVFNWKEKREEIAKQKSSAQNAKV